jgi:hypothetical protein
MRRNAVPLYLNGRYGLDRSVATLTKLAVVGGGPKFHKVKRTPLYNPDDCDDWAIELIGEPISSTSETS